MNRNTLASLLLITCAYFSVSDAEPHITASVYPRFTNIITTDSQIVLDLRLSYDDDQLPLYFTIESFDDTGPPFITVYNSTKTIHYFSVHTTGLKQIRITATNVPSGDQKLTSSGSASPFKTKAFFVKQKRQSYLYRSGDAAPVQHIEIIPISYYSSATRFKALIPIRVWDPDKSTVEDAQRLTQQLSNSGAVPDIVASDPLLRIESVQYNTSLMAWTAVISGEVSIKTFTISIRKEDIYGEPVQDTDILISVFPILPPLLPEQFNLRSTGIVQNPPPVSKAKLTACHPCSVCACVQFDSSHIIVTWDRFHTSQALSYLITGAILDARFSQNELIIATNTSLLLLSLDHPDSVNALLSYTAVHAAIGTTSQCLIPDTVKRTASPIFLSIWNKTDSILTYSCQKMSCNLLNNSMFSTPISLPNRNVTFHLTKDGDTLTSLITNSYTSVSRTGFIFEGFRNNISLPIVIPFAYGHGLFVFFDSALWISRDDGMYFVKVSFPGPQPAFVRIASSSTSTAYAVHDLTNGIVYCGNTYLDIIVPCYYGDPRLSSDIDLWLDSSNVLHLTYIQSLTERAHTFIHSSSYLDAFWLRRFVSVRFLPSAVDTFLVPVPGYSGIQSDPRYLVVNKQDTSLQGWAYDLDLGYLQIKDVNLPSSLLNVSTLRRPLSEITNHGLTVTSLNSFNATFMLQRDQSVNTTSDGWLQTHLYCTIWIKGAVFLINRYINESHIGAAVITAASTVSHLSLAAGEWRMWDSRPYRNEAVIGKQRVQLRAVSQSYFELTLTPGSFSFANNHVGLLVVFDGIWGVVSEYISTSSIKCAFGASSGRLANNTSLVYNAGKWSMVQLDFDADLSLMPDISRIAKRTFGFAIPRCPYDDVNVIKPLPFQYVDQNESSSFSIFLPEPKTKPALSLFGIQSANAMVSILSSSFENTLLGRIGKNVSLMMQDVGTCENCIGTVIFGIQGGSLQCNPSSLPVLSHVMMGCPPGKKIVQRLAQETDMLDLPVNYRPPSALGLKVPISPNIYNANPSQPRTEEFMKISQITGKYKNCTGLGTNGCVCTTNGGSPTPITQTDCIQSVPETYYGDLFQAPFSVLIGDEFIATLNQPYQIFELNGRDDFCISLSSSCIINTSPYIIDPSQDAGIRWDGEGLYHFRVVVLQGSYCELSTEFLVFVTHAPLQTATQTFVVAMTAMAIGVTLLIVYIYQNSKLQKAIRHKAAFVLNKQYITKPKTL